MPPLAHAGGIEIWLPLAVVGVFVVVSRVVSTAVERRRRRRDERVDSAP